MASKRSLKKAINNMVFDVVDECFYIQTQDESKMEVTEQFIDEAADFLDDIMSEINRAKTKADFREIRAKFEKTNEDWLTRLNKI